MVLQFLLPFFLLLFTVPYSFYNSFPLLPIWSPPHTLSPPSSASSYPSSFALHPVSSSISLLLFPLFPRLSLPPHPALSSLPAFPPALLPHSFPTPSASSTLSPSSISSSLTLSPLLYPPPQHSLPLLYPPPQPSPPSISYSCSSSTSSPPFCVLPPTRRLAFLALLLGYRLQEAIGIPCSRAEQHESSRDGRRAARNALKDITLDILVF